jgi:hypothetical protein
MRAEIADRPRGGRARYGQAAFASDRTPSLEVSVRDPRASRNFDHTPAGRVTGNGVMAEALFRQS